MDVGAKMQVYSQATFSRGGLATGSGSKGERVAAVGMEDPASNSSEKLQ